MLCCATQLKIENNLIGRLTVGRERCLSMVRKRRKFSRGISLYLVAGCRVLLVASVKRPLLLIRPPIQPVDTSLVSS